MNNKENLKFRLICAFSFVFLLSHLNLYSQNTHNLDTLNSKPNAKKKTSILKKMIIPTSLTGTALILNNSKLERELQPKLNQNSTTKIDDYLRFAPLAEMYIADGIGLKSKNHWFDQTKNAAISLFITDLISTKLKQAIHKTRPNNLNNNAFPSSHTSYSFSTATVLYEEFKHSEPLFAYSGYAFALTTGYLRIAKNVHWFSDILLGAGIGIAITKLVYHFDYLFSWNPFMNNKNIVISPVFNNEGKGLYLAIKF